MHGRCLLAACSDAGKGKESEEGVATVLPSESNEVTVKSPEAGDL